MAGIAFENNQFDDAVSRSYYAVFHVITEALYTKEKSFSSHSQVIGAFNKEFIKSGIFPKDYSKKIQTLFDDRQTGDYDIHSDLNKVTASASISFASEIIGLVSSYIENL
ncbi:MAG: HEPN domain-containing protein [Leptospiraceae bacterium]|nr:HEPN domain-containing protein [Leptospiraceae bacterium]